MSRVLLVGVGPLPAPTQERVFAPGLRLRQFLDSLRLAGHPVFLVEFSFGGQAVPHSPIFDKGVHAHRRLDSNLDRALAQLNGYIREFEPDCVVALTDIGALTAARSEFRGPLWVDYFGHPMAERQQQGFAHASDASLGEAWLHVLPALIRADRFSACSESQRLALIGELGAAGRLNSQTCGHEFVQIVPPAIPFESMPIPTRGDYLRRAGIPEASRVVLSTGGFNTWFDEETLFAGLELAMDRDEQLHFVATGGPISGHVQVVYERFERRVLNSRHQRRFHLLGWLQHEQLLEVMAGAHVGVVVDRPTIEGELGCRNRLFGWLWAGLRAVTTVSSPPTRTLVVQGLATEVPPGNPDALAAALVQQAALGRWSDVDGLRRQLRRDWSAAEEIKAVAAWADSPSVAPDRTGGEVRNPLVDLHRQFLEEHHRREEEVSVRGFARDAGRRLLGSRSFRLVTQLNPRLRELAEKLAGL